MHVDDDEPVAVDALGGVNPVGGDRVEGGGGEGGGDEGFGVEGFNLHGTREGVNC